MASGVLNMTRGLGTALGLALTGLALGSVAAHHGSSGARGGFEAAGVFLAVVAAVAAVVCAAGGESGAHEPQAP